METYATTKGQIVIPAKLRKKYGIKEGTKIIVSEGEGVIILKPVTEEFLKKLQGSLQGAGAYQSLNNARREGKETRD
jgi:AbrB family looped-hinge helix DNA binding protein